MKKFNLSIFILFFLLNIVFVFSTTIYAQKPSKNDLANCTQIFKDFPVIRGLKINLTVQEVMTALGVDKDNFIILEDDREVTTKDGKITIPFKSASPKIEWIKPEFRDNLDSLTVRFLNGKVAELAFSYNNNIKWISVNELVSRLNSIYGLPASIWIAEDFATFNSKRAICGEYELFADVYDFPESSISYGIGFVKTTATLLKEMKLNRLSKQQRFKP